jgi:prevent-host-death family protein
VEIVMREVDAFEAKSNFSELLDLAERGEEVVIARDGKEVARLVPPKRCYNRDEARAALQRLRDLAKKGNHGPFDWDEWKAYRDEGRR